MDIKQLTQSQKELVDLFISTKTYAKVRRRKQDPEGKFSFYTIERDTSPIDFPVNEEEFALKIHEERPDAALSQIYINLRKLPPNLIGKIGEVLSQVKIDTTVDYCTAIPKTAIAFAEEYSILTDIPFVDIFDKVEGDSTRAIVAKPDAEKVQGKKLVIIDDVIAHGNSKVEALEEAKKLGYEVVALVVLVDRSQGGVQKMLDMGYKTYAAMDIYSILEYLRSSKQITEEKYKKVVTYLRQ